MLPRRSLLTGVAALAAYGSAARAWPRRGGGGGGAFTTLDPNTTTGTTPSLTLSPGNLHVLGPASSYGRSLSIGAQASGKFRFEARPTAGTGLGGGALCSAGFANASKVIGPGGNSWIGGDANSAGSYDDGGIFEGGVSTQHDSSIAFLLNTWMAIEGDIGDATAGANGSFWFMTAAGYRSATAIALPPGPLHAYVGLDAPTAAFDLNFGSGGWNITPSAPAFDRVLV